ncbi:MAG: cupredoxin domain-containing protein [Bacillota bacterium]
MSALIHSFGRREPLAPLTLLAAAAMLATSLVLTYLQVFLFGQAMAHLVAAAAIALAFGLVMLTGLRWAPALAPLFPPVLMILEGGPKHAIEALANPGGAEFIPVVLSIALGAIGSGAGAYAVAQNFGIASRRIPRWLVSGLVAMAALSMGGVAVASIPADQAAASFGVSAELLSGAQVLETREMAFVQQEIRVRAGEVVTLRLANADQAAHSFDVDELGLHVPMPGRSEGLVVFKAPEPGTYTFYCAPHYHKPSGKGMSGTLIVTP